MQRYMKHAAATLGLIAGLAGCGNYLDAPKAINDPNNPTVASVNQLLVGIEAQNFGQQEGPVAMLICEWMQQCAGTAGRFVEVQGAYTITNNSFDGSFAGVYTTGGLLAIKDAETRADAIPDKVYKGILEVLESMDVMFGADNWGDIPYREAITSTTPHFDPQLQVYDDLLKLLDQAISDMGGAGSGPGAYDLVYSGDKTKWIQAARTLKARIYLRLVEVRGASQYALARTEAQQGIGSPANDWKTAHSEATSERNMWLQFQLTSFGQDLVAGWPLVRIMKAQSDPRLPDYFGKNTGGDYGGFDVTTQQNGQPGPTGEPSPISGSNRNAPTFSQPIITYDENQLILAEADFQTGNVVAAATELNTVRARYGKASIPVPTLADIMTEKYIVLFQNNEFWNDYKRTCLPTLQPALNRSAIPGRLPYGSTEQQTNPNTPPDPGPALITGRNANDPKAC